MFIGDVIKSVTPEKRDVSIVNHPVNAERILSASQFTDLKTNSKRSNSHLCSRVHIVLYGGINKIFPKE